MRFPRATRQDKKRSRSYEHESFTFLRYTFRPRLEYTATTNIDLTESCIFHSDRGSQYTSAEFRQKLRGMNIRASVGRTGVCWDNAAAESFFGALKNELIHRVTFPTHEHARKAIARYIEVFYNRRRLHSALYKTPTEAHLEYEKTQLAA